MKASISVSYDSRMHRYNWQVWIDTVGGIVASECAQEYWLAVRDAAQWLADSEYCNCTTLAAS